MSDVAKDVTPPPGAASLEALQSDPRVGEILDIVAKETSRSRSELRLDARIEDLGIESFDMVQTIFELESRFNVDIPVVPERSGNEFATVGDLVAHVLATLDKKPDAGSPG